jgi:tetratricopeptide (TPR) repeat protein
MRSALLVAAILICLGAIAAQAREWADTTGQFKVEGELVEVADGWVRLKAASGKIFTIPLERLSAGDQEFLKNAKTSTGAPAAARAASGAAAEPLAREIERRTLAFGGDKKTAAETVELARQLGCWELQRKLEEARRKEVEGIELARLEQETINKLYDAIQARVNPAPTESEYYLLRPVVRDRKAQCVGYCQLLSVTGNAIGLKISAVEVLNPLGAKQARHVSCLATLADGSTMVVDLSRRIRSKPFVFNDTFEPSGNCWDRKASVNDADIYKRIQILGDNGLLAFVFYNAAVASSKAGDVDKAIEFDNKALELFPKSATVVGDFGVEYHKAGRLQDAMEWYGRAIKLDPSGNAAYHNRGGLYAQLGRPQAAIDDFSKSIELGSTMAEDYVCRGCELEKLGQNEQAIRDFSKAIEISPNEGEPYYRRGARYVMMGRLTEALHDLDLAIRLDARNSYAYMSRGMCYGEQKRFPESIADFNKAIALNPKFAMAYMNRGVALANQGKLDDARRDVQKAVELDAGLKERAKANSDRFKLGL